MTHSLPHFGDLGEQHLEFPIALGEGWLTNFWVAGLELIDDARDDAVLGVALEVLADLVGELNGNQGSHFIFEVVAHVRQQEDLALVGHRVSQEVVEGRVLLVFVGVECVVLVEHGLPKNFIRHRSEVVGESLHYLGEVSLLEASEASHINEHKLVDLDPEVTALQDKNSEVGLLRRELVSEAVPVPVGL
eukprot:CAMPEP_0170511370 /NCGR_PEP_ID=MMETSP0208-20121228/66268_1 /TAXON_ID=197538 /ORGANISM="Strombidium inclinatum, Strain S3" /LENGTH=189 /DNA_ID=CAMNT_0010794907 /DNA_START=2396 /DNA_END=2961 /DNA_ORIENTATION=+